jgi:Mrp family chromosome partitioning ATPase
MLVVRHGQTNRGPAAEAARRLTAVEAPVIGFVLNDQPHRSADRYFDTYAAPEIRRAAPAGDPSTPSSSTDGSALGRLARS